MTFTLDTWQVITAICTVVAAFATIIKFAIDHMLTLFNERRKAVSENAIAMTVMIERLETELEELYREFLRFQTELPNGFIKRDDYVLAISELRSKLDAIAFNYQRGNPQ
jgi:septation ring formation regulator EzrA